MTKILMIMVAVLASAVYAQTSQPVNINEEISTNSTTMDTPPRTVEDTTPVASGENVPTPSNVRFFGIGGKPKPKTKDTAAAAKVDTKPEAKPETNVNVKAGAESGVTKMLTEEYGIDEDRQVSTIRATQAAWCYKIKDIESHLPQYSARIAHVKQSVDRTRKEGIAAARTRVVA